MESNTVLPTTGTPGTGEPAGALAAAFERFTESSRVLAESYRSLEAEAARLRRELQAARDHELSATSRHAALSQRFQALLDAVPGAVLVLDAGDRVETANAAALSLFGEPLLGEHWACLRERCFNPATGDTGDLTLRDGRVLTLAQNGLQPGPGRVVLLTDITGKRKVEDLLARHRRLAALGEMAAALAHQVRTPLAAGLLYATNARRAGLPAEQRDSLLARAIDCLHDLERLVADMLGFARGATLAENEFTLAELVGSMDVSLRPLLRPGQRLLIAAPLPAVVLTGNRETLASALLNLASNALAAGGEHAEVRISARTSGFAAEVLVTDNGPGVDTALATRIFEPFYTSRSDGTGLGLPVARSIARAHRGDVVLLDGGPGRTTFSLRLPVAGRMAAGRTERTVAA